MLVDSIMYPLGGGCSANTAISHQYSNSTAPFPSGVEYCTRKRRGDKVLLRVVSPTCLPVVA